MKTSFTRSLLVRAALVLLTLTAPIFSGCKKDDNDNSAEIANRVAEYKVIDDKLIQEYLGRRGITEGPGVRQYRRLNGKNNDGLYLVRLEENPNTDTTTIVSGNRTEIKYIGRYLRATNETTVFDNSTENGRPCGCLPVTVGAGQVIKGWDEGLLLMKKGDRQLLLIPSYLAYGQGIGPNGNRVFAPDEPIAFEMTILDVR